MQPHIGLIARPEAPRTCARLQPAPASWMFRFRWGLCIRGPRPSVGTSPTPTPPLSRGDHPIAALFEVEEAGTTD